MQFSPDHPPGEMQSESPASRPTHPLNLNPGKPELEEQVDERPPPLPSRPQSSEISSHSILFTLGRFCLFHFPAVALTVLLLVVYILQLSWDPTPDHLAALLLGAKVHEALIVISLFDIVYYHVRRALLSDRGVPFGYLASAFKLNSPFHFFTRQFWAPITSSIAVGILLVISFLLAFLVGASSSVLVLPKNGWWPHPDSIGRIWFTQAASIPGLPGMVVAGGDNDETPENTMYINNIGIDSVPYSCLDSQSTNVNNIFSRSRCPFDDFRTPGEGIFSWLGADLSSGFMNLTLSSSKYRTALVNDALIMNDLVVGTTPLAQVHSLLYGSAWSYHHWRDDLVMVKPKIVNKKGEQIPLKQPRVIIQCADNAVGPNSKGTYEFKFNTYYYPGFSLILDKSIFTSALKNGAPFGFIDLNEHLKPHSISTSVALWTRARTSDEKLSLCLVDARWVESDIWITTNVNKPGVGWRSSSQNPLQQSLDIIRNETLDYRRLPGPGVSDLVTLEPKWCDLLNASFTDRNSPSPASPSPRINNSQKIINYAYNMVSQAASTNIDDWDGSSRLYTADIARAMAVYLSNGMSYVPLRSHRQVEWSRDGPWKPDPNYDDPESGFPGFNVVEDLDEYNLITADYFVSASAYVFGEISAYVAFAVLLVHLVMVVVHLVLVVVVNKGWYTSVGGSLGSLLALAVESMPSGSGSGKARAYVRDGGSCDGVEIILQGGEEGRVLEKGRGDILD